MTNLTTIDLTTLKSTELKELAKEFKVKNWWLLNKTNLINALGEIKLDQEDCEAVKKANEEYQREIKEKSPKAKKARRPKGEKNQDNLITLKELAGEFGMKGTKARRLLRGETAARPYGGNRWEWDKELHKEALEAARSILKAHTRG